MYMGRTDQLQESSTRLVGQVPESKHLFPSLQEVYPALWGCFPCEKSTCGIMSVKQEAEIK